MNTTQTLVMLLIYQILNRRSYMLTTDLVWIAIGSALLDLCGALVVRYG